MQKILKKICTLKLRLRYKHQVNLAEYMYLISSDSLSRLFVAMELTVFEMVNCFAILDPLIKTFIQVTLVIGPLCLVCVILLLKKIEKDHPERIRWK